MLQYQFFNYQENEALHLSNDEKERLFQANDSIGEIAYPLGFEYPNHLSKLLNAKTGISPKELRRLNLLFAGRARGIPPIAVQSSTQAGW
ncbi:hypothetical protein [Cyclobacterium salsum]|uniref:hypothetical protein n=1 Tax=Cyclobacterium salsum TaxID=2666329 RepID=UPI0013918376|nr:hypothetical protein [Cyclobacterium salsum]